jgi:hypothetical protein
MNKEDLQRLLKETSPQDLWDGLKKIEESLEGVEGSVENLEQLIFDMVAEEAAEEKTLLPVEEVKAVAKAKGLAEPDGDLIKKYMGASIKSLSADSVESKGARNKKEAKDYHPTPEELKQINALTNVDLKAEEVLVFTLHSADDVVDRSADQFSVKALKDMATLSVDKPYLKDHSWSTSSVIGKIFDASVSKGRLMQKVYVPISVKNQDMIDGMLTGIYNKVSVGFAMGAEDYSCSSCSKSLYSQDCPHYPGSKDEKGNVTVGLIKGVKDYYEISNVTVPCQPAAGIRRDNQKGLEAPSQEVVDRISNDKSLGDNPLADEVKPEEVVEAPAPEVPAAEPVVEPVASEEAAPEAPEVLDVKALITEAVAEVTDELKTLIAELKATIESKVEVEKSAEDESTEEIARKLLNQAAQEPTSSAPPADYSKSGWSAGLFNALKSSNQ